MKIKVLFFGSIRELTGSSKMDIELELKPSQNITTNDLLNQLISIYPSIDLARDQLSIAVNQQYCKSPVKLKENDEVALLPPISGG